MVQRDFFYLHIRLGSKNEKKIVPIISRIFRHPSKNNHSPLILISATSKQTSLQTNVPNVNGNSGENELLPQASSF